MRRSRLKRLALAAGAALLVAAGAVASAPDRDRLPVVVGPAPAPGGVLAVVYSGDGGWAGIDRSLSRRLSKAGVGVVGVDSLRYFWNRRTASDAAADLTRLVRTYEAAWRPREVALIGYSFGAGALPALWNELPDDVRAQVREVVLIAPEDTAELKVRPLGWLDPSARDAIALAPALRAMSGTPVTCIYGDQDRKAACPRLPADLAHVVRLPGRHHFGGHFGPLGRAVLRALQG